MKTKSGMTKKPNGEEWVQNRIFVPEPETKKLTADIPGYIHKKLKLFAAIHDKKIHEVVTEALREHINKKD